MFDGLIIEFGVKNSTFGSFLAKMSYLRGVFYLQKSSVTNFMIYAINNVDPCILEASEGSEIQIYALEIQFD